MASSMVHSNKMKRLQSKKSHSWWWDSHISPKNSKWLAENLELMDQSVRRMLKLIEEDADSFAKKVEIYYQKRPELISLVEEFYRMYRSLAERYDNVTGELRKNITSDLQSQGSGISDIGSDAPSTCPSPAPEQRASRRRPGPRAAGFDFFLGSGTSGSDFNQKEGDESSTLTDSESESDDSSVNNYSVLSGNSGDQGLNRKVIELEIELREMREKLQMRQDEDESGSSRGRGNDAEELVARISGYEQELTVANERTRLLSEEITRLNLELEKYKSSELTNREAGKEFDRNQALQEKETLDSNSRIQELTEELRITKERLQGAEKQVDSLRHRLDSGGPSDKVNNLQEQLALAHKDINSWKTKLNAEKRQSSKLQERIARLKSSLSDRDHEVRELTIAVSDAEQKIFPEKAQIKAEISRLLEERTRWEEQLKEWESRGRLLEDEIRKVQAEKKETEGRLGHEIERLEVEIAVRDDRIENLNKCLGAIRRERDELDLKSLALEADKVSRNNRISEMDKHLQQLQMQHGELVCGAEDARKLVDDLKLKIKELEEEVEKQKNVILEGAEEKREAIRQLCLSIEHYRNSYNCLRQAFMGYKRIPVLAS